MLITGYTKSHEMSSIFQIFGFVFSMFALDFFRMYTFFVSIRIRDIRHVLILSRPVLLIVEFKV